MIWAREILAGFELTSSPTPEQWSWANLSAVATTRALAQQRLLDPAASALAQGRVRPVSGELTERLNDQHRRNTLKLLHQAAVATRLSSTLGSVEVPALFVKGMFQSSQTTGDFAFRGVGDIDVLVGETAFAFALQTLIDSGARLVSSPGTGSLGRKVAEVHHAAGLEWDFAPIDLHRRLDPIPGYMRLPIEQLMRDGSEVVVAGTPFRTLGALDSCIFVASHGSQDNWASLRHLVDFALAFNTAAPDGDIRPLIQRAQQHGVEVRLRIALEMIRPLVPLPPQPSFHARAMATWGWTRHRQGRHTRNSPEARDATSTFTYWIASGGDWRSVRYAVRRLTWLPSATARRDVDPRWLWAYPLGGPIRVVKRLLDRRRGRARFGA